MAHSALDGPAKQCKPAQVASSTPSRMSTVVKKPSPTATEVADVPTGQNRQEPKVAITGDRTAAEFDDLVAIIKKYLDGVNRLAR